MNHSTSRRASQGGMTILVVLVLLSVMLLGGLALARMTSVSTMVAGNVSFKERALQASDVGVNAAFAAVSLPAFVEEPGIGSWYFASAAPLDANGLPTGIDLEQGAQVIVGTDTTGGVFNVRYVVERMCSTATVTDTERECLLRQAPPPGGVECAGGQPTCADIDPPAGKQFRITARVVGPKGTRSIVQTMVTRGG